VGTQTHARIILLFLLTVVICGRASALHSSINARPLRHARRRSFRSILYHPLFRPTHDSLLRQNEEIERLELPRIQDDAELEELKSRGELLPIRASESLRFDPRLDPSRRYCRPWTRDFVEDLGAAFYQQFHAPIQVNSAVRTVEVQHKLRRHNRNAAPENGETGSSHLAGITVDIQRRGLTGEQIQWIEQYMLPLNNQRLIEPEEERHEWVFHVMVSDRYQGWHESNVVSAQAEPEVVAPPQLTRESGIDLTPLAILSKP
jgi:Family of unknown function (DUF5715)